MKIMCPNCKQKISSKSKFCNFCSNKIENVEKKKYNPSFLICGIIICIFVAVILIYANSETKKTADTYKSQNKFNYGNVSFDKIPIVINDGKIEYKINITDAKITLETDSMIFIDVSGYSSIINNTSYYTNKKHYVDFIVYDDNNKIGKESEYIDYDDGFTCKLIIDKPRNYKNKISISVANHI